VTTSADRSGKELEEEAFLREWTLCEEDRLKLSLPPSGELRGFDRRTLSAWSATGGKRLVSRPSDQVLPEESLEGATILKMPQSATNLPSWGGAACGGRRSNADDVKPRNLIYSRLMHLDELPSVRVTDMRRSGGLTPDMSHISVTLHGDDGSPVSTAVPVVRVRMRSGAVFLQFICGYCGRRARILRLYAGRVMCGRCTGLRYWCEGKPAVRRAQHRVERLKATRFHGSPVSRRPGAAPWNVAPSSQPPCADLRP
jgi:hypothetical protein